MDILIPRARNRCFVVAESFSVRARHRIAEIVQHLGDAAHARAADADEMDVARKPSTDPIARLAMFDG